MLVLVYVYRLGSTCVSIKLVKLDPATANRGKEKMDKHRQRRASDAEEVDFGHTVS